MEQQMPESFLQVTFLDKNSSAFSMMPHNVSPMQLLALAGYLRLVAEMDIKTQLERMERNQQMNKIVVPGGNVEMQ